MAQQSQFDTDNKIPNIFTIQPTGEDPHASSNESANNSVTSTRNSIAFNEHNKNLSLCSLDLESGNALEEIYTEDNFAHEYPNSNSVTDSHNPVLSSERNTNLSICSLDLESINTSEDIHNEENFAHEDTNSCDDDIIISQDQATPEDDTNLCNRDITKRKTLKGIESSKRLKDLMTNDSNANVPRYYALLGALGVLLGWLFTSTLTIVPQTNAIQKPEYWYDFPIIASIGFGIVCAGNIGIVQTAYWMNLDIKKYWKSFFSMVFIASGSLLLSSIFCYVLWVIILKYNHPMPMNVTICGFFSFSVFLTLLWYQFPETYRADPIFKRQMRYFLLAIIIMLLSQIPTYPILVKLFQVSGDSGYQWTLAFVLPLLLELTQILILRAVHHSAQCNDPSVRFSVIHMVGARHTIFVTIILSSFATNATSYTIFALDFMINMILCFKIIWSHMKNNNQIDETQMDDMQGLALNEHLEFSIPIGYCLCFLAACYGPNSELLYAMKDADVEKTMKAVASLFTIDLCSGILSAVLLWKLCRISVFNVYLYCLKEFWPIMTSQVVWLFYNVRYLLIYPLNLYIA